MKIIRCAAQATFYLKVENDATDEDITKEIFDELNYLECITSEEEVDFDNYEWEEVDYDNCEQDEVL